MKTTLILLCATAASAFGLHGSRSALHRSATTGSIVAGKPLLQPQHLPDKPGVVGSVALSAEAAAADGGDEVRGGASSKGGLNLDIGLISYFALWYLGNYYVRRPRILLF